MPRKKFGRLWPRMVNPMTTRSTSRPRFIAATMPPGMPIKSVIPNARRPRLSVAGMRSAMIAATGRSSRKETPKSPCTTCALPISARHGSVSARTDDRFEACGSVRHDTISPFLKFFLFFYLFGPILVHISVGGPCLKPTRRAASMPEMEARHVYPRPLFLAYSES